MSRNNFNLGITPVNARAEVMICQICKSEPVLTAGSFLLCSCEPLERSWQRKVPVFVRIMSEHGQERSSPGSLASMRMTAQRQRQDRKGNLAGC
ncbi:hypothetical protein AV530_003712 [Patagioenas fasciata monilis]|uniref:Uncharacterized protein n=1 Tax=Patagioenas fasciata monilis TaxID=372326 RepID=A0A1V4KYK1_PATFA|nr:hypothetical protein AV530_003712 [Patagioenas fasciata monilis]